MDNFLIRGFWVNDIRFFYDWDYDQDYTMWKIVKFLKVYAGNCLFKWMAQAAAGTKLCYEPER